MLNFTRNRFPIKNLLIDSLLAYNHRGKLQVYAWIEICTSLHHRKKTKADGSRLIPRKHTETVHLLVLFKCLTLTVNPYTNLTLTPKPKFKKFEKNWRRTRPRIQIETCNQSLLRKRKVPRKWKANCNTFTIVQTEKRGSCRGDIARDKKFFRCDTRKKTLPLDVHAWLLFTEIMLGHEIYFPKISYESKSLSGFLSSSNASCVQCRY